MAEQVEVTQAAPKGPKSVRKEFSEVVPKPSAPKKIVRKDLTINTAQTDGRMWFAQAEQNGKPLFERVQDEETGEWKDTDQPVLVLTRTFHWRGQVFGVGETVASVKATMARWEKIMLEGVHH